MEWKLELVQVPVSDVDRAKAFYTEKAGFTEDHDHQVSDELRFVQLTPPGSACSIAFGIGSEAWRQGRSRACSTSSRTSKRRERSSSSAALRSAMSSTTTGARSSSSAIRTATAGRFGSSRLATDVVTAKAVVLVEGLSDQAALEALARQQGRDLDAEGVSIVSIGGAQAIGKFLDRFGPKGLDLRLAGLYDAGEERDFRRGLERAGLGDDLTRAEMERLGFYVCVADLEDELIRALGVTAVEDVVDAQGDLGAFRSLQRQPPWRDRPPEEQLRRFFGSGSGRKIRYARLLVEALELEAGAAAARRGGWACLTTWRLSGERIEASIRAGLVRRQAKSWPCVPRASEWSGNASFHGHRGLDDAATRARRRVRRRTRRSSSDRARGLFGPRRRRGRYTG